MIKIKTLFSNLYKKLFNSKEQCAIKISLLKGDNIQIDLIGFNNPKGDEDLANYIKLLYVLFTDIFEDMVINNIVEIYKNDPETSQRIIGSVLVLLEQNSINDDDNDEPIVDPCNVFAKKDTEKNVFEE